MVYSNSSKKRTKQFFLLIWRLVFVRFLEEMKDTKNHFEIIWPFLPIVQNLHDFLFSVSANIWFVLKNVWNVYLFLIIYLLICNTITSLPFSPRPFEVDFGGLPSKDSIIICRPPCNGRLSGLYRVAKFRLWLPATTAAAQCVELALRWQLCAHSSRCPEIYFKSKFWIIFAILNTRSCLWFARKHIWNIIEGIFFEKSKKSTISDDNFWWQFLQ